MSATVLLDTGDTSIDDMIFIYIELNYTGGQSYKTNTK